MKWGDRKNKHKWWENHSVIQQCFLFVLSRSFEAWYRAGIPCRWRRLCHNVTKSPQSKYLWHKVCSVGEILKPGGSVSITPDAVCFIAFNIPHWARGKLTGIIVWMDLISRPGCARRRGCWELQMTCNNPVHYWHQDTIPWSSWHAPASSSS